MAKKSTRSIALHMTQRSLRDLIAIEAYSVEQFGRRVANQYLDKLESGINRIKENPDLLREEPPFHASLKSYRIEKHVLVCETGVRGKIIVLTLLHGSMDIPARLAELEPALVMEVAMLLKKLK
ncbi:type II toxin-antitoxin system RelE/ParE family toxin [Rubripirellula sp.]|nr:type II toxin-antitoxin system RelE/ParE family toxin [Rubripirellula sp.]MDF1842267.1 type II toxin-antitoxin system RelE/ParE family toxin [Rubripirellula sp.]